MNFIKYLLFAIIFALVLININTVNAELVCPIGLVNDTAPGSCGLYIDKNIDSLCDLSQELNDSCDTNITATDLTSTEIKSMTVEQVAEHYGIEGERFAKELSAVAKINIKLSDSFQYLHDNYALRPAVVREIAIAMSNNLVVNISDTSEINNPSSQHIYPVLIIVIATHLLYLLTFVLSKRDIISINTHRKIWNWLLLVVFIPVMVTSILWLLRVEYNIIIPTFFNVSYLHVVSGLIMIIISAFHILWHVKYYFVKRKK